MYINDHLDHEYGNLNISYSGTKGIFTLLLVLGAKIRILLKSLYSVTLDRWLIFTGPLFSHCEKIYHFSEYQLHKIAPPILPITKRILSIYREKSKYKRRKELKTTEKPHSDKMLWTNVEIHLCRALQGKPTGKKKPTRKKLEITVGPRQQPPPIIKIGWERYTQISLSLSLTHTQIHAHTHTQDCTHQMHISPVKYSMWRSLRYVSLE